MKKIYAIVLAVIFCCTGLFALDVPTLKHRVTDRADLLGSTQESELENLLRSVEDSTSSQVALLTVPSLEGESLEDYSIRVVEKNKLGQKDLDNGVLVLVAKKERKLRIEVGYGLESILTDAKCDYIIRLLMVPYFKKGNYYGGIKAGLSTLTGIVKKEFDITPEQLNKFKKKKKSAKGGHFPFGLIVFIFLIIMSFFKKGSRHGRSWSSGSYYGGGYRSSSSSGSSWGGGGFSGGGGSFGGGGASGDW